MALGPGKAFDMKLTLLRTLMALPAVVFIVIGLRWLVAPDASAAFFGMTIMEGLGLSTQIGDMAAIFLTLGLSVLAGLVSGKRTWFLVPSIFLVLVATARILAWAFHGATFAADMIAQELLIAALWFFGSRFVCETDDAA